MDQAEAQMAVNEGGEVIKAKAHVRRRPGNPVREM